VGWVCVCLNDANDTDAGLLPDNPLSSHQCWEEGDQILRIKLGGGEIPTYLELSSAQTSVAFALSAWIEQLGPDWLDSRTGRRAGGEGDGPGADHCMMDHCPVFLRGDPQGVFFFRPATLTISVHTRSGFGGHLGKKTPLLKS